MEGNKDTPHRFMEVPFKKWKEGVFHKNIKRGIIATLFAFIDERNSYAPSKAFFPLAVGLVVAAIGVSFGTLTGGIETSTRFRS
ncbi:hypothetical protein [Peribacillus sp. NPDC058075]|uniref:hypothetical protein n=1 Tax=unclassified Peribacillus TaxID=2675266 RepID=UPI0036DD7288